MSLSTAIFGNSLRTYDPKNVTVVFGVFPIGGFADKSSIGVTKSEPTYEKVVGINGIISRGRNLNKSGEVAIVLAQTSLSNAALSLLSIADELTGDAVLPLVITEITGGGSTIVSAHAWIRKTADPHYGKELEDREWIFDCADIDIFNAGNKW